MNLEAHEGESKSKSLKIVNRVNTGRGKLCHVNLETQDQRNFSYNRTYAI